MHAAENFSILWYLHHWHATYIYFASICKTHPPLQMAKSTVSDIPVIETHQTQLKLKNLVIFLPN